MQGLTFGPCLSVPSVPTGFLASLTGQWVLDRTVDDGTTMAGEATILRREDSAFDYCEQGKLTLPRGHTLDAERRYVFTEEDRGFAVLFAGTPPRLFHRVALRCDGWNLIGGATHVCGADRYDSRYEFHAGGGFSIEHRATGPRKRYAMVTRYRRAT